MNTNITCDWNDYSVEISEGYIYLEVKGYDSVYQIKMEDEGLVIDTQHSDRYSVLFHCTHDEALLEVTE